MIPFIQNARKDQANLQQESRRGTGRMPGKGTKEPSGMMEMFCILTVVVIYVYTFVKTVEMYI